MLTLRQWKRQESMRGWCVFAPKVRPAYAMFIVFSFRKLTEPFYLKNNVWLHYSPNSLAFQRLLAWMLTLFSKFAVSRNDSPSDHNQYVEAWALKQIISFLCGRLITFTTRVRKMWQWQSRYTWRNRLSVKLLWIVCCLAVKICWFHAIQDL